MKTRKDMKRNARGVLKRHYWLFVTLCVIAGLFGLEFASSLVIVRENVVTQYEGETATSTLTSTKDITDQFLDMLIGMGGGKEEELRKQADEHIQEQVRRSEENKRAVLGRSQGVLSGIVNKITSGQIAISLVVALRSIVGSNNVAVGILVVLSLFLYFAVKIFGTGIYRITMRRMFLEGRRYEKVYTQRAMFLLKVKKWCRASITLFIASIYQLLWDLTIIGGIIKHYSYMMVPYILAENPGLNAREAVTLSRNLMKGHKWECFKLEWSFFGWGILGGLTFGLSAIFYSNPYEIAVFGEYYEELRRLGKERRVPYVELLNDKYLFRKAEEGVLCAAYEDVAKEDQKVEGMFAELTGVRRFMATVFGLTIWNGEEEKRFEKRQEVMIRLFYDNAALEGRIYPTRLYPIPEKQKREWLAGTNYIRCYSIWSIIMMFFIMSFIGWLWEVSLHLISDGAFVNRGVLHGPWLPIYGAGSVMILLLLNKFRRNPAMEFVAAVVVCGTLEYMTSYILEVAHNGKKWWDYSGYFLNLNGRICAEGLLVFGLGGMVIVYLLAPVLDNLIKRIPFRKLVPACLILIIVITADWLYSAKYPNEGKGITDYESRVEDLEYHRSETA